MSPNDDRLSFLFPMWNEEAMIRRTFGSLLDADGLFAVSPYRAEFAPRN